MLEVLAERRFPAREIRALASPRSAGVEVPYGDKKLRVEAGQCGRVRWSRHRALLRRRRAQPRMGSDRRIQGRMRDRPLVCLAHGRRCPALCSRGEYRCGAHRPKGIIANPNCSTIQMLVALAPLHRAARIRRIVVSTYQAISGAGAQSVDHFRQQASAYAAGQSMPKGPIAKQLAGNLLMEWKRDVSVGYQEEELKMVHETRKILGDASVRVSPTTVACSSGQCARRIDRCRIRTTDACG